MLQNIVNQSKHKKTIKRKKENIQNYIFIINF